MIEPSGRSNRWRAVVVVLAAHSMAEIAREASEEQPTHGERR
jgi:hypothetical protein